MKFPFLTSPNVPYTYQTQGMVGRISCCLRHTPIRTVSRVIDCPPSGAYNYVYRKGVSEAPPATAGEPSADAPLVASTPKAAKSDQAATESKGVRKWLTRLHRRLG